MKGLIMDYPLTLTHFFERARRLFPKKTLGTRVPGVGLVKYTYADFAERTARLAGALAALGVEKGDRVGTLAWNSHRHLEVYFAAPLMGAVLHTVNLRLSAQDITYIVNHAGDQVLITDASLWHVLEPIRKRPHERRARDRDEGHAGRPDPSGHARLRGAGGGCATARRMAEARRDRRGRHVLHVGHDGPSQGRGLHASRHLPPLIAQSMVDVLALSERDVILHIVPMFHANAWCVPFAGVMNGATQLFGGPNPQPRDILEIIHNERVTFVGAVPTVWIAIQAILEKEPGWDISCVSRIPIGGSAAPRALIEAFEKKYGASMLHAWGMTEMTPLGTVSRLKSIMEKLSDEERYAIRAKQGYNVVCVDIRIVDEAGMEQPWDGKSVGEIQVRGPWITSGYYNNPAGKTQFTADGWFRTGDVASIDPEGYVQITDRTKDLIKSGGEWISSVDLETTIMDHPKVLEAAVIAVPHEKWQERPLACVVPKPEFAGQLTAQEILDYLAPRVGQVVAARRDHLHRCRAKDQRRQVRQEGIA